MTDFKEQCSQVRTELELAYKTKLNGKIEKFKNDFTNFREKEIKQEFDNLQE